MDAHRGAHDEGQRRQDDPLRRAGARQLRRDAGALGGQGHRRRPGKGGARQNRQRLQPAEHPVSGARARAALPGRRAIPDGGPHGLGATGGRAGSVLLVPRAGDRAVPRGRRGVQGAHPDARGGASGEDRNRADGGCGVPPEVRGVRGDGPGEREPERGGGGRGGDAGAAPADRAGHPKRVQQPRLCAAQRHRARHRRA